MEMSLSLPAKSTTPLSPHVGMYDGPAGRCIVSERIGGTVQRTVGPAERAAMHLPAGQPRRASHGDASALKQITPVDLQLADRQPSNLEEPWTPRLVVLIRSLRLDCSRFCLILR